MSFVALLVLLAPVSGAFLTSPPLADNEGILDDGVGGFGAGLGADLAKLVGRASSDERTLHAAESHNADLTDNIAEMKSTLRKSEKYSAMIRDKAQQEDRLTRALRRNYRKQLQTAFSAYRVGTRGLRRGFRQCSAGRSNVNSSLVQAQSELAKARLWRTTTEAAMSVFRENGRRLRQVVANATVAGIRDLSRDKGLDGSLARETEAAKRAQGQASTMRQKALGERGLLEAAEGRLGDLLKHELTLRSQLQNAQAALGSQANTHSRTEAAWSRDGVRMKQDLANVRAERLEAENNATNAQESLQNARRLSSDLRADRDQARRALQQAKDNDLNGEEKLRKLQAALLAAQSETLAGQRRLQAAQAEANAQGKRAQRLVTAHAKLEVAARRVESLDQQHSEVVKATNVWKQKVKDLNGTLGVMTRLSRELGLTRADLASREEEVAELKRTKALLSSESRKLSSETKDLNATEAQLAAAALEQKLLQAAQSATASQARELNATRAKLGTAVAETKALNTSRTELAAAIKATRKATIVQGGNLTETTAKEHVVASETEKLKQEIKKAGEDSKAAAELEKQALEQEKSLQASKSSQAAAARELASIEATTRAVKERLEGDKKNVEAAAAKEATMIAALHTKVEQGARELEIAQKAETSLAKELASVKDAITAAKKTEEAKASKATTIAAQEEGEQMQIAKKEVRAAQAEQNSTAQKVRELEEQTIEARELIIKDVHLLTRCREHGKQMKTELEAGFQRDQHAFQAEVQTKYEAMTRELTTSKKEQESLVEQNKALLKLMGELRDQLGATSK